MHGSPADCLAAGARILFRFQYLFVLILFALLVGRGPERFASQLANLDAAIAWADENGIKEALGSALVDGADVLALGESAHGARDVFIVRAELTKRLILDGWARALILEADAWDVCALERKILPMAKEAESGT